MIDRSLSVFSVQDYRNNTVSTALFPDSENNQIKASQHGKLINFVAAKQREVSKKVATKQKCVNMQAKHHSNNKNIVRLNALFFFFFNVFI